MLLCITDSSPDELLVQSPQRSTRNYTSPPHGPSAGKSVKSSHLMKSDNVSSFGKNISKGKTNHLASSSVQKNSSQHLIKHVSYAKDRPSHKSASHYLHKRSDSSSSDSETGSAPREEQNPVGLCPTSTQNCVELKPVCVQNSMSRVSIFIYLHGAS